MEDSTTGSASTKSVPLVPFCVGTLRRELTLRQPGPGYGMLPPKIAPLVPWSNVAVDLIGPWKITTKGKEIGFNALSSIDLVSNLAEIIWIDNKTSEHVAQ
eukprot:7743267-Ditylum_brightwellii.AAC.1